MLKIPSVVIYWADTHELLNHMEMMDFAANAKVISITPMEILMEERTSKRKVVVRGITDAQAPRIPGMNYDD